MTVWKDRVYETTTTTGTGNITLDGTTVRNQSFNQAHNSGDQVSYVITHETANEWEVGKGTFTSPSTLSRDTVEDGSDGPGNKVLFTAGTKDVFSVISANDMNLFINSDGDILSGDLNFNNNSVKNAIVDNTNTVTVQDVNFTIQDDGDTSKQAKFNCANIPTGNIRNYVLPGTGGTFAISDQGQTFSGTQVFANVVDVTGSISVDDGGFTIRDSVDSTKQAQFDTSAISANNTRTYQLQDTNGTLSHTDTNQTVTGNNTFTGDVDFTGNVNMVSGTVSNSEVRITDGITTPTATVGYAQIFVDSADGDLKVIFGDGTVKTIVTNP